MSRLRAVIFDMDGVLIDSERFLVPAWVQAAREAGFDFSFEDGLMLRSLDRKLAAERLKSIFGNSFDYTSVRRRRQEIFDDYVEKYGLLKKSGADELLDFLAEKNIKRIVATASDAMAASERLARVGIINKVDKIVSAAMVACGKPKPDIYLYACECAGEEPDDCIAIEDSPNGVISAHDAGLRTVMVPDLTPPDEFLRGLCYSTADSLTTVKSVIADLLQSNTV